MTTISTSTTLTTAYICSPDTTGTLILQTGATPTTAVYIDGSQNVGIGTSSPLLTSAGRGNLTVNGSSASIVTLGVGGTWNGYVFASGSVLDLSSNNTPVTVTAGGANYVGFNTNGTERMRIDSSGNVGIGVTPNSWISAWKAIDFSGPAVISGATNGAYVMANVYLNSSSQFIYKTSSQASYYQQSAGAHYWAIAGSGTAGNTISFTQAMTLDSSGNLGVGTSSPSEKLTVNGGIVARGDSTLPSGTSGVTLGYDTTNLIGNIYSLTSGSAWRDLAIRANQIVFFAAGTDRGRVDTNGNFIFGGSSGASARVDARVTGSSNNYIAQGDTATTAAYLYWGYSASASRFIVYGNGGIANVQANNVNLSDRAVKKDFAPSGGYLEKICAIPVQTFRYIDQQDDELNLGVVAQDVQAVAPELVTETNWGTPDEPKMCLSVYQTDLQYALMKAIQEQQAIIQSLTQRIETLEAK